MLVQRLDPKFKTIMPRPLLTETKDFQCLFTNNRQPKAIYSLNSFMVWSYTDI